MNTRRAAAPAGTITSPSRCWPAPSSCSCSRTGGEKMPQITRPQVSRVLRALLPQCTWTVEDLLQWLVTTQERNERAKQSHIKRRLRRQHEQAALSLAA